MWYNIAILAEVLENKPPRKVRTPDKDHEIRKLQREELYRQKGDDEFVDKMRISRTTFNTILNNMWDQLVIQPTNFKQNPTSPDRQLALTLYRLAHEVRYAVLEDVLDVVLEVVFGISKESGCIFFIYLRFTHFKFTRWISWTFPENKFTLKEIRNLPEKILRKLKWDLFHGKRAKIACSVLWCEYIFWKLRETTDSHKGLQ